LFVTEPPSRFFPWVPIASQAVNEHKSPRANFSGPVASHVNALSLSRLLGDEQRTLELSAMKKAGRVCLSASYIFATLGRFLLGALRLASRSGVRPC